ncbi:hypothetical protein R3P38DRAFT_2840860 [Favolaschia claudopus]|uniref:Uncharacterized protein n=1 Tax=Favolaschia claudopus TaxID=2862362 RepID=A0AAW0E1R2_9AGAR
MKDELVQFLSLKYGGIKSQYPGEGRRKWVLRALQDFWTSPPEPESSGTHGAVVVTDNFLDEEDDPFDELVDGPQLGLLVRTDFSDGQSWKSFCERLKSEEQDMVQAMQPPEPAPSTSTEDADVKMAGNDDGDDSDDESTDGLAAPIIIKIVEPVSEQEKTIFENISNLRALRLLNDVDIRLAPTPPSGTKRFSPPNRLVDQKGWQEIYTGPTLWIYDAQSNKDQCARLVSQQGDIYGTATGDSWRARVTHICELQFNMTHLQMKIDFGGMDRYDYPERKRNLEEADSGV